MARTIYKYTVPVDDQPHRLPDAIKHVEPDGHSALTVWAELDPNLGSMQPSAKYQVFGTGHTLPIMAEHVGTVLADPFVWHLYRLNQPTLEGAASE